MISSEEKKIEEVVKKLDGNSSLEELEGLLTTLWKTSSIKPTSIVTSFEAIRYLAQHRPNGGNSRQRRKWSRSWMPRETNQ